MARIRGERKLNKQTKLLYAIGFAVPVIILAVSVAVLYNYESNNNHVQLTYINDADCTGLEYYIDAGNDGKDFFAIWTSETQKTVNMRITMDIVDLAEAKYDNNCIEEIEN